jgi:plasmid stabilization system protein ParE
MIVQYLRHANKEVIEAAEYYSRERFELGSEFPDAIDAAEASIKAEPLVNEQFLPGIRRHLLDRFPYGIYHRMPDANTVRIIAVKHHSRRPGLGMRRT